MRRRPPQQTDTLLRRLKATGLDCVVIGGVAAIAHGATLPTQDLGVACNLTVPNLSLVLAALAGTHPMHATRPDLGELREGPEELARYRLLLLQTDLGRLDVMGSVEPLGPADGLRRVALDLLPGETFHVLPLEDLIAVKAHVGRPKDKLAEAELRAILALRPHQ